MTVKQGRIDVHHHVIPPPFVEAMTKNGIDQVAGAPLPTWSPEKSIHVMDTNGIQTALLSLSAPGVFLNGERQAIRVARACNEYCASLKTEYQGRFGYFAVLPMPLTEPSCKEAIYALDHLEADGVVLLGSTRGVFLGDDSLEELMTELNRRSCVVFIHPNLHDTSEAYTADVPGFLLEFLCDTTRAAVNLMLQGVLERYPNIHWILAHSGGFLPYIAHRLTNVESMDRYARSIPEGALHYVRRFYYDTALSPSRYSQVALKSLVSPSQILFGSDFPFAPAPLTKLQCNTLGNSGLWDEQARYGINRGNALDLFPQYHRQDEQRVADPIFAEQSMLSRFNRQLAEPIARVAERLRKH